MSKKCTALWREACSQVKRCKNAKSWRSWTTFWIPDAEKMHAVVARSMFATQKVLKCDGLGPLLNSRCEQKCSQGWNLTVSDDFLNLTCRKDAHRCGANRLSIHRSVRPAIHNSQQPISPIYRFPMVSYLWNFRHCLVWYNAGKTLREVNKSIVRKVVNN